MIKFKDGVDAKSIHPAVWLALGIAYQLRSEMTVQELVVTAMSDTSGHMVGSYHYPGSTPSGMCQAVDLRTVDLTQPDREEWYLKVKHSLTLMGYDVVLESPATTGKADHLHIEYQPHALSMDWASYVTGPSGDYKRGV